MRVLFLTHRLPYAPNRGDRVRAYHMLRELGGWAEVDLVSLVHDADEASHVEDVKGFTHSVTGVSVPRAGNAIRAVLALPTSRPTTHSLLRAPAMAEAVARIARDRSPDLIFSFGTGVAPYALDPAARGIPLVLDVIDVDSEKWRTYARKAIFPLSWVYGREARLLQSFEAASAARARLTLLVTEKEKALLTGFAHDARIEVIENGVDVEALRRPVRASTPEARATVVFCGVMNYAPNVEGAIWLARDVWPIVRKRRPDAQLQIVGSHPSRAVLRLDDASSGICVTGQVPDVRPYLWDAAVAVAPLFVARGVQNKVLEAVAAGLPVVVTPAVFEGLPVEIHAACTAASEPAGFAEAILANLHDKPILGDVDLSSLSWEYRLRRLKGLLTQVVRPVS